MNAKIFLEEIKYLGRHCKVSLIRTFFEFIGYLSTILTFLNFFSFFNNLELKRMSFCIVYIVIAIVYSVFKNFRHLSYRVNLENSDVAITLAVIPIMKSPSKNFIVPTDTDFEIQNLTDLKKATSVSDKFQLTVFKDEKEKKLLRKQLKDGKNNLKKGKHSHSLLGKVVCVENKKNGIKGFFVAVTSSKSSAQASRDDILRALGNIWEKLRTDQSCQVVSIPLIGTGLGKSSISRNVVIKSIILSFIQDFDANSGKTIDHLIICIKPEDFVEYNLDWDELCSFLRSKGKNHKIEAEQEASQHFLR